MLLSRSFALLSAIVFALPAAADVLTVGPSGSGAQFPQIQTAINAAADDDVILVKPGHYQAISVNKPVRILADGTGTVSLSSSVIRDIGAGEEAVVSGLWIQVNPSTFPPSLLVRDCAGTVVLQDLDIDGDIQIGVRVQNCIRVVVLSSRISAGVYGSNPTGAVSVADSEVWIAGTSIRGSSDCCFASRGAHGIELLNSRLHVWSSQIRGATVGSKQGGEPFADGGTGIKAVGSTMNLFGGPTSLVSGGHGFDDFWTGQSHPGGPGLDLAQDSHARIQQALPVTGGFDGDGAVQAPAILVDGTSSATLDPKVFPTLVASAQQVQLGSTFTLTLAGNPGGYQVLFLSLRTGPTSTPRGVDGFGMLDRANLFKITSEVLPASGTLTVPINVPSTASLLGTTLFFQAAERFPNGLVLRTHSPANRFAIGNPVLVTITR